MPEIIAGMYEIQKEIGAGGGGVVYLGKHLRLGKTIVLKADKRSLTAKPEALRREVDALKNLSHTYIPQVYDFLSEGDTVYTVMDYIEGESLDKPLKRGERFSQPQVIEWSCQLLEALRYLHTRPPYGILHSDIKPANIMVTPQGDIRLIDYNIALALGEEGTVRVGFSRGYASPEHYGLDYSIRPDGDTRTGASVRSDRNTRRRTKSAAHGTEIVPDAGSASGSARSDQSLGSSGSQGSQGSSGSTGSTGRRGGVLLDVRSDIYSVGATLYHLLTGICPSQDAREVQPIGPNSGVSPALAAVVAKAMRPNPDERYQTAAEMLDDIKNLRRTDPRARRHRRRVALTATVVSLLFLAGGFLAFMGQRQTAVMEGYRVLVQQSVKALEAGDTASAVRLAASTLKREEERGLFDPPNLPEAQKSLTDALGVYDLSSGFADYRTLDLPSEPLKARLSPDGTRLAAIYAWEMEVYDMETLDRLAELHTEESALCDVVFLDEDRVVYAGAGAVRAYDVSQGRELWDGETATTVVRSADGHRIAAVNRDSDTAYVYDADTGEVLHAVSFQGKHQWVAGNDRFLDPGDNLFALNADGSLLAVSFEDGSLTVYYLEDSEGGDLEVLDASEYVHFEGGFCGPYLAFTAQTGGKSLFAVIDTVNLEETVLFETAEPFGVQASEDGVFLSHENNLVRLDPESGEQTEAAYTEKPIGSFRCAGGYTIVCERVADSADRFTLFDAGANAMRQVEPGRTCDFVDLAGPYALTGSRNSPTLRFLKLEDHGEARVLSYNPAILHDEARMSADGETAVLFHTTEFHILDREGNAVYDSPVPDPQNVYDQQFRRDGDKSWLEITWYDGTVRDYSAADGSLLDERHIDPPDPSLYEEFETDTLRITRTMHEAPVVYDKETGKKLGELEQDDTLTYVDQAGENLITWYITTEGEWYGLLLDGDCETLARLPRLCDVLDGRVYFDYPAGEVKESVIYTLEELLDMAEAYTSGVKHG